MILETLESSGNTLFAEFIEKELYSEYFDNRLYLAELYLDAVTRIMDHRIAIKDVDAPLKVTLDGYI